MDGELQWLSFFVSLKNTLESDKTRLWAAEILISMEDNSYKKRENDYFHIKSPFF